MYEAPDSATARGPYAALPHPQVWQCALDTVAHEEYEREGEVFADWFTNDWSVEHPEALLKLVTCAGGTPSQRVIAATLADTIYDDWMQAAADMEWTQRRARRLVEDA